MSMFVISSLSAVSTSWIGGTSDKWRTTSNWTNGIPNSLKDAVIGDGNFTGPYAPKLDGNATCLNLTIGDSATAITLTIARNLSVYGNILIGTNGTILANSANRTITISGNWTNNGAYTATSSSARVTFSGSNQSISGTTASAFQDLYINNTSILTLSTNISVASFLSVSGVLDPGLNVVSGAGSVTLNSTAEIKVYTSVFTGNYPISGSKSINRTSKINYASASTAQTVSSSFTYGTLIISGGSTKSLSANLPNLSSSNSSSGNIFIYAGTFDLNNFTANRSAAGGGSIIISAGATLLIGGTNSFPSNYLSHSLAPTSTVEYDGANQTVMATSYGNLSLKSSSGVVTKTMPSTALTIAGNFTSSAGLGTGVNYTAAQVITVNKDVVIGSGCTFNGASYSHVFKANWTNSGTFTGSTSTATFNGISSVFSGTGTNNFNNLVISAFGINATSTCNINVSGNLTTSAPGIFTHASGGTVNLTGTSKSIIGNGFVFSDLNISGTISTSSNITIAGDLSVNGTLTANAGRITMNGASKTISGSGTPIFYSLRIDGTISTSMNLTINSNFAVSSSGSYTASAGNTTFDGTSSLSGEANLFNVIINSSRSLTLGGTSVLGIAGSFTKTGSLDVNTNKPNTVNYNGSGAQTIIGTTYNNLVVSNGGTKTSSGAITVSNDFTIDLGVTFDASSYVFSLYRHWNNEGTFIASTSDVQLRGTNAATLTGATTFNTFTVNKTSSIVIVTLDNDIIASDIIMTTGIIYTGSNSITTTGGRSGPGIIIGTITHDHSFANATPYAFEGPNNLITFTNPSGISTVTVTTYLGEVADFDPAVECVTREYEVSIALGTYTDATFRMHYENNELNAFSEPFMAIYKHNSGILWDSLGFTSRDTAANYVELTGITTMDGRFTGSGVRNIVRWNGSVSTNWNDSNNWTTISGSSMANRVPTSTDAAQIGYNTFTYQPNVSSNQTVSVLRFGSAQAVTLTISNNTLFVEGSARGQWTVNRIHDIVVTSGNLNVGTNLLLSDGVSGNTLRLSVNTGAVTVNNDLIQSADGSIVYSGSGAINIYGDYLYSSGTFNAGSGTFIYKGGQGQLVAPVEYNNLTFDKTTESAFISSYTTILGNLLIQNSGEIILNDDIEVSGNITLSDSAVLFNDNSTIFIGGNWLNNGNYISHDGLVVFNGTGSQTVNSTNFANLEVDKASGTLSLTGDLFIDGDLSITSGTLNLSTYIADRVNSGGILTIASNGTLVIGDADNFPNFYASKLIDPASTVNYNGTVAQNVRNLIYGNLTLTNGGVNAKSIVGNIQINGNFIINSGVTFSPNDYSIELYGNFVNSGTFNPGSSDLILNGVSKLFSGTTTLNNLSIVNGSYTVTTGTISMSGNLDIEPNGSLNFGTNTAILDGDLINYGTLSSAGIATFTGSRVQNIQLINAITSASTGVVNFNGSVSPIINSTASPSFATVNINNTAGIVASIDWNVFVAMNIASGSSFDGAAHTHTFYGDFNNDGNVSSSGRLVFSPGTPYSSSGSVQLDGSSFVSTGEIEFAGTAPITITSTNPTLTNVKISNTHSSGVTASSAWSISDEVEINANAIFNASSFTHIFSGSLICNGTFNGQTSTIRFNASGSAINGLGTITFNNIQIDNTSDLTLNTDIYVNRNFILNGVFDGFGRSVIFSGTTPSNISGSAGLVTFGDLEHAKSGDNTTLSVPVTVTGNLEMTNNLFITSSTNIITIADNATASSGNSNSYVSGPMIKEGDDAFVFPIGKSGRWARLGISAPANTTDAFQAEFFNTAYSNTSTMAGSPSPVLNNVSNQEYWMCDRIAGPSNVTVQLFWETTLSGINSYTSDLVVARWNGSGWENKGQSAITASTPGSVTSNVVTSFSPFTFGSLSPFINPLPVKLLSFEGELNPSNKVDLIWKTASEENNHYFTIERSRDGIHFSELLRVESVGNSNSIQTYTCQDNDPYTGVSYYRLRQTDFNGHSELSKSIVIVYNKDRNATVFVYPNPTTGVINVELDSKETGTILIKSISGETIEKIEMLNSSLIIDISAYPIGIYFLVIETANTSEVIKILKQ